MSYKNPINEGEGLHRYTAEDAIIKILKIKNPRSTYELPSCILGNDIDYNYLTSEAIRQGLAPELRFIFVNTFKLLQSHNVSYEKLKELEQSMMRLGKFVDNKKPHIMIDVELPGLEKILKELQTSEEKESGVIGRLTYGGFEHTYHMNHGKGIHQQGSHRLS